MPEFETEVVPLEPGYAIASPEKGPGTMGGFIYSPRGRAFYILSNAHVLAPNPFVAGAAPRAMQPNGEGNLVSTEIRYEPIRPPPAVNRLDVGIALFETKKLGIPVPRYEFGHGDNVVRTISGVRDAQMDEPLTLCSHQWPQTSRVTAIHAEGVEIPYYPDGRRVDVSFSDLVQLSATHPVSLEGSSGGLFVSPRDGNVVLLGFSGGDDRNYGYGIPIRTVLAWVQEALGDAQAGLLGPSGVVYGPNGWTLVDAHPGSFV